MSDAGVGALLLLIGGLVGSLATIHISRANRKEVLRLAAVDKRLAVHEEAFAWCSRLLSDLHHPSRLHDTAVECQKWRKKNCLYLDPNSRAAFQAGTLDAALCHGLKGEHDPVKRLNAFAPFLIPSLREWVSQPLVNTNGRKR